MLSYLIHAQDYQNINMHTRSLTIVGEDYQDIYKANKINWQRSTCKTEEQKIQVNEYQIDALH